jgi:hypothetical protein
VALVLEDINLVKQRCRSESRKPASRIALDALFEHLQQRRNPDLKFKAVDFTANADIVVSDAPCRLYALLVKKPAASIVTAYVKGSDDAATCNAASDLIVPLVGTDGGGQEVCLIFPDGLILNTGLTVASHTTVAGAVDSADADSAGGFFIVGAK